jgi:hypothetical protein
MNSSRLVPICCSLLQSAAYAVASFAVLPSTSPSSVVENNMNDDAYNKRGS